jgi:UDP-N-acetylmuramate: L-alanyl-gamma-D-glutamyl-meso-diaminopimelate ligase
VFNNNDPEIHRILERPNQSLALVPYGVPDYHVSDTRVILRYQGKDFKLQIFGDHNLQNLMGAARVGEMMGIEIEDFFRAMSDFRGAGKRLQAVVETACFKMFKDFAHSPSKLKATTEAVRKQFSDFKLIACMELHTFSSLKKDFLPQYKGCMEAAHEALVYFNPQVVAHKRLEMISADEVSEGFGGNITVANATADVLAFIQNKLSENCVLLMMSSGNFDGIDFDHLGAALLSQLTSSEQ